MLIYPVPTQFDQIDVLKSLNSIAPSFTLTNIKDNIGNIKDNIGNILSYRATYRVYYIPCILNSHILSDQWAYFFNEHTLHISLKQVSMHKVLTDLFSPTGHPPQSQQRQPSTCKCAHHVLDICSRSIAAADPRRLNPCSD